MRFFFFLILTLTVVNKDVLAQPSAFPNMVLKTRGPEKVQQQVFVPTLFVQKNDSALAIPLQSKLPLNFYSEHMGAACKMELQLEKQTRLPIRIRLGSKEQVDYLEGKFSRNR